MTQNTARKMRDFWARKEIDAAGGLRFVCKDSSFRLSKEFRVRGIQEKDGVVTWMNGHVGCGTSAKNTPLVVVLGGVRLEVKTRLVKRQQGLKVLCMVSGTVPQEIYDVFSIESVSESAPRQKKRRK